jgi:hypothetical protein
MLVCQMSVVEEMRDDAVRPAEVERVEGATGWPTPPRSSTSPTAGRAARVVRRTNSVARSDMAVRRPADLTNQAPTEHLSDALKQLVENLLKSTIEELRREVDRSRTAGRRLKRGNRPSPLPQSARRVYQPAVLP